MTTQNKYLINTLMIHIHKINTKILIRAITEINNLLNPVKEKSKYQIYKASNIDCQKKIIAVGRGKISTYHISSYSFHRNYSFLNLEIVANSNSCRNLSIVHLIPYFLIQFPRKLFFFEFRNCGKFKQLPQILIFYLIN